MKTSISISLILSLNLSVFAQNKNDYIWQMGYNVEIPAEPFGGTTINFHSESPEITTFDIPLHFTSSSTCSDKNGNLLFYSNSCLIANKNHEIMMNGDSLNFGSHYGEDCSTGYPSVQGALSLPLPNNDSLYYLFHLRKKDNDLLHYQDLLFSVINMKKDNGNGAVILKNELVLSDDFTAELTAVRHGNGRDWWIVLPKKTSNKIYLFLFDPTGIHFSHEQNIGSPREFPSEIGQAVFSPDGEKYIRANNVDGIHIYSFDRCAGFFDFPVHFYVPEELGSTGAAGCAVSSNSKYLYVSALTKVYQYDLDVPYLTIEDSRKLVGEYDNYVSPFPTTFFQGMLAPDEKIYMSCTNANDIMHVIHNPNGLGDNCDFENHGLQLPKRITFQVPNFPYFRLYDMEGSVCDTLGINQPVATKEVEQEIKRLHIFPNPTTDFIQIEFGVPFTGKIFVTDLTGKVILEEVGLNKLNNHTLHLEDFPNGIYQVTALNTLSEQTVNQKLIIQK